jgi:hypothetical protein
MTSTPAPQPARLTVPIQPADAVPAVLTYAERGWTLVDVTVDGSANEVRLKFERVYVYDEDGKMVEMKEAV